MRQLLFLVFTIFSLKQVQAEPAPGIDVGQSFLKAMGGAEVWREANFVHNWAVNWNPKVRPGPYSHDYWIGLDTMRQHITLKSQWVDLVVAYDDSQGWQRADGALTPMDAETLTGWQHDWETSLYRKIYLLAMDDPNLGLELDQDRVLHFSYAGEYLGWVEIGPDGAPTRLGGARDKARFVTFEPLASFGDIAWPAGGHDQTGWRFEIFKVELAKTAPVSFEVGE